MDRAFDFLIGCKHSLKVRQINVSFRDLKPQIYCQATDQKVWGSNPYGRTYEVGNAHRCQESAVKFSTFIDRWP